MRTNEATVPVPHLVKDRGRGMDREGKRAD